MKFFKRIIAWSVLSLILQVSVLFILDRIVFKQSSVFNSNKIEVDKPYEDKIDIKIPNDAENTRISYNGKYISYCVNDSLNIVETKTGISKAVETDDNGKVMYYEWLSERDRLVIVEKVNKKGKDVLDLVTYNPKDLSTSLVTELCSYEDGMKVKNVTESIFTTVYYIYVSNSESNNNCYRVDINNDKFNIKLKGSKIENMSVIPHTDRLIYDDTANNSIYATSPDKKLQFNSNNKLRLLGIDRNDVIYIGEMNGEKVSKIIYGKIDEESTQWNEKKLDSLVDSDDLFFSDKSEIIVNDILQEKIFNITTGKEFDYTGKIIDIKDNFIAVNSDGSLRFQKF